MYEDPYALYILLLLLLPSSFNCTFVLVIYYKNNYYGVIVPAYTGIYQMRCTAYKVARDDGLI